MASELPPTHHLHDAYSAAHPVPTVQEYQRHEKEAATSAAPPPSAQHPAPTELQVSGSKDASTPSKQPAGAGKVEAVASTDEDLGNAKSKKKEQKDIQQGRGGRRTVMDPVTGNREVEIEDIGKDVMKHPHDEKLTVPRENVVGGVGEAKQLGGHKETNASAFPDNNTVPNWHGNQQTSPTQPIDEYAKTQDVTSPPEPIAPHTTTDVPLPAGSKTNLLFHPTPTLSLSAVPVIAGLDAAAKNVCIAIVVLTTFLPFVPSVFGLPWAQHTPKLTFSGLLLTFSIGSVLATTVWLWTRNVLAQARAVDWASEPQRGEISTANLIPESVEWLNTLLGIGWRLVNPEEMLAGVVDMLEDVMQASVPGVVESVRVADVSQGEVPMRILSLRSLPDHHVKEMKSRGVEAEGEVDKMQQEADDMGGEWYNLEASIAYHAAPVKMDKRMDKNEKQAEKSKNLHLLVVFRVGIPGTFSVPIPIWVELTSLVVTARIRLQMIPTPPFLSQLTFTLMGSPQVSASCLPMSSDQKGLNVLDLPFISGFVDSSIKAVAAEYVAPKSMTMDLKKMLEGDDVKKDTEAMGVVVVRILRAEGLSRQDRSGGGADAYVTLGWSKFGKPMYSTRVIAGDLNPVWGETGYLLVRPEHVKAEENLSVELWDSDRLTSDDVVGKVEVPLKSLLLNPGTMHPQSTTSLAGLEHDSTLPGTLVWEVGYFPKTETFRPALRTNGEDARLGAGLQGRDELKDAEGTADSRVEDGVLTHPPDPLFPQGVLSVVIHQCVGLEVKSLKGTFNSHAGGGREWEPGMPHTGELTDEEGAHLPSGYVTLALNDQLIYRTRTKALSSRPIFNAGTERFVADWRSAQLTVCVRDSRLREHDPVLGVVPIKLGSLLETRSQVTRWFPLDAGVGFGRIRVSVLWRALDMTLERPLCGWEVGVVEFVGDYVLTDTSSTPTKSTLTPGKLRLRTGGSVASLPKASAEAVGNAMLRWDTRHPAGQPKPGAPVNRLRLPVKHRHMSPLVLEFHSSGAHMPLPSSMHRKSRSHPTGYAILWLTTLTDHDVHDIDIPIYNLPTKNAVKRMTQNQIFDPKQHGLEDAEVIGHVKFQMKFLPGMAQEHQRFATTNDERELFEMWEACFSEGIRSQDGGDGKVELPRTVARLHGESIAQLRRDLAAEPVWTDGSAEGEAERRARLTDKYGVSWEGILAAAESDIDGFKASQAARRDSGFSQPDNHSNGENSPADGGHYDPYEDSESDSESSTDTEDISEGRNNPVLPVGASPDPDNAHAQDSAGREITGHGPIASLKRYRAQQRTLHRKHQGLMQWKPMRTVKFVKDEAVVGVKKMKGKVGLGGGKGGEVETEV